MQIIKKSFKSQVTLTLLIFALISTLISLSVFLLTSEIYRDMITKEIEDSTVFLTQSIDNYLEFPEDYLLSIKNHVNLVYHGADSYEHDCIIVDLINFVNSFESIYLLDKSGKVIRTWPNDEDFIGIDMTSHEYFMEAPKPETIYWSDTFLSNRTGFPTVALTTSCEQGQIIGYYNLRKLENFISLNTESHMEFIAVIDARGNIVAHSDSDHSIVTENISNMVSVRAAMTGKKGTFDDYSHGKRGLAGIKATKNSNFYVLIFKSNDLIFRRLKNVNYIFLGLMFIIAALYILVIRFILNNFLKPLNNLQKTFHMVASGSYETLPHTDIDEFIILTESFEAMVEQIHLREKALKDSIEDRETLLRELNHRTKNNMQLIIGIMRLYTSQHPEADPQGMMERIQSKIQTISLVHDQFYSSSDLSRINFREYIEDLIPPLLHSLSDTQKQIYYKVDVEDIYLLLDYAVPCGLILNEFIINTLKYAFEPDDKGAIHIEGKINTANELEILYSDNGRGLPRNFDPRQTKTLGFSIIRNIITSQLYGDFKIIRGEGFKFSFRFSLDTIKKRI